MIFEPRWITRLALKIYSTFVLFILFLSGCASDVLNSVTSNGYAEAPATVYRSTETVKEWEKSGTWFRDCSDENRDVPTFVISSGKSSTQLSLRLPEKSLSQMTIGTRFNLRIDSIICNDDKQCGNIKGGTLELLQQKGRNWRAKFTLDDGAHPQVGEIWFLYEDRASVPCGS